MYSLKHSPVHEIIKAFLSSWLFYIWGGTVYFIGILENWITWKADVLFVLAAILAAAKLFYYIKDKIQSHRERKVDLERKKFELDRLKRDYEI